MEWLRDQGVKCICTNQTMQKVIASQEGTGRYRILSGIQTLSVPPSWMQLKKAPVTLVLCGFLAPAAASVASAGAAYIRFIRRWPPSMRSILEVKRSNRRIRSAGLHKSSWGGRMESALSRAHWEELSS